MAERVRGTHLRGPAGRYPGMISEQSVPELARQYGLTPTAAQYVLDLRARLSEEHRDDPEAWERAFSDAVRTAWVEGAPWAQEWVNAATAHEQP
ncbi:hypothetical protein SUDANB105_08079 (plasmid) [Streptomyces sp. enrichment culture]